jgi:hypothetical protein
MKKIYCIERSVEINSEGKSKEMEEAVQSVLLTT